MRCVLYRVEERHANALPLAAAAALTVETDAGAP
jgi:hypothetical protein